MKRHLPGVVKQLPTSFQIGMKWVSFTLIISRQVTFFEKRQTRDSSYFISSARHMKIQTGLANFFLERRRFKSLGFSS